MLPLNHHLFSPEGENAVQADLLCPALIHTLKVRVLMPMILQ